MLEKAKKWVQQLETTINELAQEFNEAPEVIDEAFENWYQDGGYQWEFEGPGPNSIVAFATEYRSDLKEESEGEEYEEVYKKMRTYADNRGYELSDEEIRCIIEEAEEDGDSVLDCADGALRELTEDWVADHQE